MLKYIRSIFDDNKADLKKSAPLVKKINELESIMEKFSDEELFLQTKNLREKLKNGQTLDDILPEAFSAVREVSKRHTGLRHYDVQMVGGILLHWGNIAEMKTGEGKTLVATLTTYLNALSGKGVHVVTVNDYLARRDAVWVGQIYARLGMSVSVINSDNTSYIYDVTHRDEFDDERDEVGSFKVIYEFLKPVVARKDAYQTDITYGTNSEFGFDYLRDNITQSKKDLRQKELSYAIIDEVDSVLIDEARVPLIISSEFSEGKELYVKFNKIANTLIEDKDYEVDKKTHSIIIKNSGIDKTEKALGVLNMYSEAGSVLIDHLETAVKAKSLFKKEKEYVVKDGEVIIIDEFTGRMQPGRRWSDGVHQAIESKEGVEIKNESRTYASITYQNYFKLYKKISGMTGTAETSKEEFHKVYGLDVVVVPTNKKIAREDKKDLIFATEIGKFKAIAEKIKKLNIRGQPVLVGTASVEKSELLSHFLIKMNLEHNILNAKNHENEGQIIADAGRVGSVTIATNMAGRGVDIKLGGSVASDKERNEVLNNGGLYVLGTERHESRRTDNQLRGRSGRQGDVGETQFFISLEDNLMKVFGNQEFMKKILKKKMELEGGEDVAIESKIMSKNVEKAQEKIEGLHFDSRKHVLQYDDVLDIQRKSIYSKRRKILKMNDIEIFEIFENDVQCDKKIKENRNILGEKEFSNFIKRKYLEIIDSIWIEHLNVMEHLKSSVSLQAYGQKDPILEYKKTAKEHFDGIFEEIHKKIKKSIMEINIENIVKDSHIKTDIEKQAIRAIENSGTNNEDSKKKEPVIKNKEQTVRRNELCPCSSGKKYKKCCGKN